MKTPPLLLILTCGILFALTFAPHNATVESMPGSIFVDDEWRTKPSVYTPPVSEYTACIKITGNRTVEEIMVYHPGKTYTVAIDDEGYVIIHFNLTLDEFADDVIRFAEINAIAYEKFWCNGTTVATVGDFFDICPVYSGKGQCVSCSRYYAFEAEKHNLSLQTCVIGGQGSAQRAGKHQVNTFEYDGVRYFTGNFNRSDTTILTSIQLIDAVNDKFSTPIKSLNARDFWQPWGVK